MPLNAFLRSFAVSSMHFFPSSSSPAIRKEAVEYVGIGRHFEGNAVLSKATYIFIAYGKLPEQILRDPTV